MNSCVQHFGNNMLIDKFLTISSDDRDVTFWPHTNEFEVILGDDIRNIYSVEIKSATIPTNIHSFSNNYKNTKLTIGFGGAAGTVFDISAGIYPDGTYIANAIESAVNQQNLQDFIKVYYDTNSKKTWFVSDSGFTIYNSDGSLNEHNYNYKCDETSIRENDKEIYKNSQNWGLGYNLGLKKENTIAEEAGASSISLEYLRINEDINGADRSYTIVKKTQYYIQSQYNINLQPDTNFYVEMESQNHSFNNIIGCRPYQSNVNSQYNSSFNSNRCCAIASLENSIQENPLGIAQWDISFGRSNTSRRPAPFSDGGKHYVTKTHNSGLVSTPSVFNPPLSGIRKLKFKIRFHDGRLVDSGKTPVHFLIHFKCTSD